jgi:hypothetical protein
MDEAPLSIVFTEEDVCAQKFLREFAAALVQREMEKRRFPLV